MMGMMGRHQARPLRLFSSRLLGSVLPPWDVFLRWDEYVAVTGVASSKLSRLPMVPPVSVGNRKTYEYLNYKNSLQGHHYQLITKNHYDIIWYYIGIGQETF
jgi:hypothetical protein